MADAILTFSCDDQPGIVNAVTGAIVACQGNILELQQFSSLDTGRFFMRVEVVVPSELEVFRAQVAGVATGLGAKWAVHDVAHRTRTLVLVSKAGGPLNDLLFHVRAGDLGVDIVQVLGNHPDLATLSGFYGVDFDWQAIDATDPATKDAFEARVREVVACQGIELVVLARYMQIVSPQLCNQLAGRMINIHHSFLPGFKGANPYRQAHSRGVKLIGATAHFVTPDLDEGPIIEQNVTRVNHSASVAQLTSIGQGLESRTLTHAVELFASKRIFLDGIRTVIFEQ